MAKRVVITGAAGYIAQRMLPELAERYELVLLDVTDSARDGTRVPDVRHCDLTEENRDAYREHFRGADAVVHLGFVRAEGLSWEDNTEVTFRNELANVAMCYNVYKTCLEEGVPRAVVASSNHATDFYERLLWREGLRQIHPHLYPLSDNYYGWAKAAYEELGFVFATGEVDGRVLEQVHLRIGAPRENILDTCEPGEMRKMNRGLGMYLSRRDLVQLTMRSIDTPDIRDEHGVPFQVVYGISNNSHAYWDLTNARRVLGYAPEDDSSVIFADRIREIASGDVAANNARWDGRRQP